MLSVAWAGVVLRALVLHHEHSQPLVVRGAWLGQVEALASFSRFVNCGVFDDCLWLVFLNKFDVFEEKMQTARCGYTRGWHVVWRGMSQGAGVGWLLPMGTRCRANLCRVKKGTRTSLRHFLRQVDIRQPHAEGGPLFMDYNGGKNAEKGSERAIFALVLSLLMHRAPWLRAAIWQSLVACMCCRRSGRRELGTHISSGSSVRHATIICRCVQNDGAFGSVHKVALIARCRLANRRSTAIASWR